MKLINLYSDNCISCKTLESNLKEAGVEYENVNIESERGKEIIKKYKTKLLPVLLILNDDLELVGKRIGILTVDKIKRFVDRHKETDLSTCNSDNNEESES